MPSDTLIQERCIYCGAPLIWQSDFSRDDVFCDGDTEGMVAYWLCSGCGKMYEISDPAREDRDEGDIHDRGGKGA